MGDMFNNSGLETAMDLIESLNSTVKRIGEEAVSARTTNPGQKHPKVVIRVIVLGGGTYPTRDTFALGETMEPIRALLSTRESRAYVALNGAVRTSNVSSTEVSVANSKQVVSNRDLRVVKLENRYYDLPLGWAISQRTRDIINKQSGRFWDCDPSNDFTQLPDSGGSDADCLQLQIYHELSQTLPEAMREIATANYYRAQSTSRRETKIRYNRVAVARCFGEKLRPEMRLSQSRWLLSLLREWDQYDHTDQRWLAHILGASATRRRISATSPRT